MAPIIPAGTRKLPTTLDMAGLYDLGWEVVGAGFPPKTVHFPEDNGLITCRLGQLGVGESTTVTVVVDTTVPGAIVNTATVSHGGLDAISWNNTAVLTTSAGTALLDTDADGVLDASEDAGPAGGDANGDGTVDRLQNSIASLPNAADGVYMSLQLTGPGSLNNVPRWRTRRRAAVPRKSSSRSSSSAFPSKALARVEPPLSPSFLPPA